MSSPHVSASHALILHREQLVNEQSAYCQDNHADTAQEKICD